MKGIELVKISTIFDSRGKISIAEIGKDFDFAVERIYFLSDIEDEQSRGAHAHAELRQFMLCVAGEFDLILDNGSEKKIIKMKNDGEGILIDGLVWRTMNNFSEGAVMLVLCDRVYSKDRVIRNYDEYLAERSLINVQ
jgi:hypothetical protein